MDENQSSEALLWVGVPQDNTGDLVSLCNDVRQIGTPTGESLKVELLVGREVDAYRAFIVIALQKKDDAEEMDLGFLTDDLIARNLHVLAINPIKNGQIDVLLK